MSSKKKPSYSEAMAELEGIVRGIETESIDVDSLTEKVSRARFLIGYLKSRLTSTEEEVKKILSGIEKEVAEEPAEGATEEPRTGGDEGGGEGLF